MGCADSILLTNKGQNQKYDLRQYLMCLMVSSVSLAFLTVPVISSRIYSLRFRIEIACWSWSEYISTSSIRSLLTSSYSLIRASNLSSSPFSFLLSSKLMKCSFLSFSSSAMMMSSWFSSLLILVSTSAILWERSLPLAA